MGRLSPDSLTSMTKDSDIPSTQAVRLLRDQRVEFTAHLYDYLERGGTAHSAIALAVDEYFVIKTLVLEDERKQPLICLQHGNKEVSTKKLARVLNVKSVSPCTPDTAHRHTGYQVGGTSPFGTRKHLPVYIQQSILTCERVFINGGKRGFLVALTPAEIVRITRATAVDAAA